MKFYIIYFQIINEKIYFQIINEKIYFQIIIDSNYYILSKKIEEPLSTSNVRA